MKITKLFIFLSLGLLLSSCSGNLASQRNNLKMEVKEQKELVQFRTGEVKSSTDINGTKSINVIIK